MPGASQAKKCICLVRILHSAPTKRHGLQQKDAIRYKYGRPTPTLNNPVCSTRMKLSC